MKLISELQDDFLSEPHISTSILSLQIDYIKMEIVENLLKLAFANGYMKGAVMVEAAIGETND